MKGYKAFNRVEGQDKAGKCRDMLYEEGQEYHLKGELKMCENGFHFCKDLLVTGLYYDMDHTTTAYAEVEALGEVVGGTDNTKYATDHIKVVRFLSEEEAKEVVDASVDRLAEGKSQHVRYAVAKQGYGLEKLVDNEYWSVRAAVAEQGYGLEKLVDDEEWIVRAAVAEQGYGLKKLVNDEDWHVRRAVARQGYGLDKLVNDGDCDVRLAVAEQGYGLEKLVDDDNWRVRLAVAEQGHGLEKLVNDVDWCVRGVTKIKLRSRI